MCAGRLCTARTLAAEWQGTGACTNRFNGVETSIGERLVRLHVSLRWFERNYQLFRVRIHLHFLSYPSLFLSNSAFRGYPANPIIYNIILKHSLFCGAP